MANEEGKPGLAWSESDALRMVSVIGAKEPTGLAIHHLIAGEHEFRQELIAVRLVDVVTGVITSYEIIRIVVEGIAPTGRAVFRKSVGSLLLSSRMTTNFARLHDWRGWRM